MDGLVSGTLPEERFRFYIAQDSLYLSEFGPALAVLGAKSRDQDALMMFCRHATNTVIVERALHQSFARDLNLSENDIRKTPRAPNCLLYTSWISNIVYSRPYWEGIGAVLACYWIYWEVGKELIKRGSPHPLYARWISTYGGDEFGNDVKQILELVNQLGDQLTPGQRESLAQNWEMGVKMEYLFWDMGWNLQKWEI